jgi:hypothetical protein
MVWTIRPVQLRVRAFRHTRAQHLRTAQFATAQFATARFATAQLGTARFATAQLGTARFATAQLGTARFATAHIEASIRERAMAGLIAARARGRRGGRPTVWTEEKLRTARAMRDSGQYDVASIARVLGVSCASVYRALSASDGTN